MSSRYNRCRLLGNDTSADSNQAFDQSFAEMIATLLYRQPEMRANLCRALQTLVQSLSSIVQLQSDDDEIAQGRISRVNAQEGLDHVSKFSSNLLAVLFNVYGETTPQFRGPILSCINAYLGIMKPDVSLSSHFSTTALIKGRSSVGHLKG